MGPPNLQLSIPLSWCTVYKVRTEERPSEDITQYHPSYHSRAGIMPPYRIDLPLDRAFAITRPSLTGRHVERDFSSSATMYFWSVVLAVSVC